MITSRIQFDAVYDVEAKNYTTEQLTRGFVAYGIHIMNNVRAVFPAMEIQELIREAYSTALEEYAGAVACVAKSNLPAPDGFLHASQVMNQMDHLIRRYYRR